MATGTRCHYTTVGLGLIVLLMGSLVGCSDSTDPGSGGGTGTLRVFLVDAPTVIQNVTALEIVFDEVRVHRSGSANQGSGGWITVLSDTLPVEDRTFDLLELVDGVFATLGEVELAAGRYTQVRIVIDSATVTVDGQTHDLFIPSGQQSGIKLVGTFTVEPDVITDLTLDFDVARSLHEAPPGSGNYILRPTIRMMQTVLSGGIAGTVEPLAIGAVIYALVPDTGDTLATTLANPTTGNYHMQALPAGLYDVHVDAESYVAATVAGVTVTAAQVTAGVDFVLERETD